MRRQDLTVIGFAVTGNKSLWLSMHRTKKFSVAWIVGDWLLMISTTDQYVNIEELVDHYI
jgi:hypothetical protein